VQPLRSHLLDTPPAGRPEFVADALANWHCSPLTVVTAAAQTACDMYLMVDPVPHQDYDAISREVAPIHLGNTMRLLRTALGYMSPRTQALAAIQAGSLLERGPSVLNKDFAFVAFEPTRAYPYTEDVAALDKYAPDELITHLRLALHRHDCRQVTGLVRAYADHDGHPDALIALLIEVAATDNGTLMHNIKHLNSMVLEFQQCDHLDRWNFLIQAAKFISWYAGLTTEAYGLAERILLLKN
jgi:hypothetical protein